MLPLLLLTSLATAADADEVRAFFDDLQAKATAFDVAMADLYADRATVTTLRDGVKVMEVDGATWKSVLRKVLPTAKERGDLSTYKNVQVAPHGDGFRVTAERFSKLKCATDEDYHLDVARVDGAWRIVGEHMTTTGLILCKPSKDLAKLQKAIAAGVAPHLPLDLDAETRLLAVDIEASNVIYRQQIHTATVDEFDMAQAVPLFQQIAVQNICGTPDIKKVTELGGNVRYHFVDKAGARLTEVDVGPGLCP